MLKEFWGCRCHIFGIPFTCTLHDNIVDCILYASIIFFIWCLLCSTGNSADGPDTDEAKQFITTTNKKAAIKVRNFVVIDARGFTLPSLVAAL